MQPYTILIPIHNEVRTIVALLDGLESHSNNGHEIIIIDDGSKDGSTRLLQKCSFIKLICLKNNKGKGHSIKRGILESTGTYIIFHDADLEYNPSDILKFEKIFSDFEQQSIKTKCNFFNFFWKTT